MTAKQQMFVKEYLIDLNQTQAAIRAGYSPKTAEVQGARLLMNAKVKNAIAIEMAKRSRRTGINADRVVREIAKIALANQKDIIDPKTGTVIDGCSRDDTAAVQSIKVKKTPTDNGFITEYEVKLHDKLKALEQLMRHLGQYNDKLKLENFVPVTFAGEGELV